MFNSQYNQDKFLEESVFKGYKKGVYMDVGAHDGISINNTLYFEENNGWTGINIEPIKSVFDKLMANRPNAININCAVCNTDGETDFLCNKGETEMISGIRATFDPRHIHRLARDNRRFRAKTKTIKVPTKRMETILDECGITHINYLSVDVEGAEFEVIKSINFEKVFIDVIDFENNYDDVSEPIINYLMVLGYKIIFRGSDIIMINQLSNFYNPELVIQQ